MEEHENKVIEVAGDIFKDKVVNPAISGKSKTGAIVCYVVVASYSIYKLVTLVLRP